jgi:cytochrome P450
MSCFAFFSLSNPLIETKMLPEASSSRLPIVGASAQFLWHGPHRFIANQISRFQEFFKLSILGFDPIVVATSPEFVKFVLVSNHKSVFPSYPKYITKLLGINHENHSLKAIQINAISRKSTLATFSGENLKKNLPILNSLARQVVDSLQSMGTIFDTEGELLKYAIRVAIQLGWSEMVGTEEANKIKEELFKIQYGMLSIIRINLPPFTWNKALKASASFLGRIEEVMAKRREKGIQYNDFLCHVMEDDASVGKLSDRDKCAAACGPLIAATSSTSLSLTMVLKYLHDYPQVRESIKVEQDALRNQMIEGNSLEWFNWKTSMPLTTQMINEVLRLHSLTPFIPRETEKNMSYKDYNIPEKWLVWISPYAVHMNPKFFPNPMAFDPSRFQTPPKLGTFLPFGMGPHICPGKDFAMIEILFFVHHFVTKCRWESLRPNQPIEYYSHGRKLKGGFPMIIQRCG